MIEGSQCECGKKLASRRKNCPHCNKPMKDAEFNDFGRILSHTTLYAPPEGFEGPIRLCIVELEGGVQLLCRFSEEDIAIEDQVKVKRREDLYFCEPWI